MTSLLKPLVIHGDVHAENVCRRRDNSNFIVLIDFGRSTTSSKELDGIYFEFSEPATSTFSPWQLEVSAPMARWIIIDSVY